jgi:acetyl esterase
MARDVCRGSGAVVVAVDYRLAPEHPFPAAADDGVAAARWIAARLDEFGGDQRLGLAGDSAGGNLSAVTQALHADGTPLKAQFLIHPAVDEEGEYPSRVKNAKGA